MTKITAWKCDVCGNTFYDGDGGYLANTSFSIEIPSSGAYDNNHKYDFSDMCLGCKNGLNDLISHYIDNNGKITFIEWED
jgi:hypothetical protein